MLENVDLEKDLDKESYKELLKDMSGKLALLQRQCKENNIPVIIVFEGFGASGKGVQINRLIAPLDPRGFYVFASSEVTKEERQKPFLWRYWVKTPAKGRIAIFDRSWYRSVAIDRFDGFTKEDQVENAFHDIKSFERQLTEDGFVIIKLFLHISKEEQKKRFQKLLDQKSTRWRVTKADLKRNDQYKSYLQINEEMIERTDEPCAPWTIVEANHKDYASIKIMATVIDRMERALNVIKNDSRNCSEGELENLYKVSVLSGVNLSKCLEKDRYKKRLDGYQSRIEVLHSEIYRRRIPVILAFEGWDAAGKGGAIKRLTSHLDPRGYAVNPIAAPNDIEKDHHYLWRFWNHIPRAGHIAIFDRTWYGRVMVERVENFSTPSQWGRAYQEINEMEAHLINFGAIVIKFWLHIDKDEQEKRFQQRMEDPSKQWKITDEDWRNRDKWDLYETAVNEMLLKTSTKYAPWTVVEANDKHFARVKVLDTVVNALEKGIKEKRQV